MEFLYLLQCGQGVVFSSRSSGEKTHHSDEVLRGGLPPKTSGPPLASNSDCRDGADTCRMAC